MTAGVDAGWVSGEVWGGTAVQAGGGDGAGGSARALGPEREAGLQVSEAGAEPLNAPVDGWRPEPAWGRSSAPAARRGPGAPQTGVGAGGGEAALGRWAQAAGGPGSSPGSSPGCALGLTR